MIGHSQRDAPARGGHVPPPDSSSPIPWLVLVVDDEPEVYQLTDMLLARTTYDDRPIDIRPAYSAREALQFLRAHDNTALVLLDVVMESDDAGLRLVRSIREELGNHEVQIVVRTGQPGQAPERDVIVEYEINGYFLKTELTAQKVHSIVISALRNFDYIRQLRLRQSERFEVDRFDTGKARRSREISEALRAAIESGQLEPLVQAQLDLHDNSIRGFELSWRAGRYSGFEIPALELSSVLANKDLIDGVTNWLVRHACNLSSELEDKSDSGIRVWVTMPGTSFKSPNLAKSIRRRLSEHGLNAARLGMQIDEVELMDILHSGLDTVDQLQKLDIAVSVRGFGRGPSSVIQVHRLQPAYLKIDPEFVQGVPSNPESCAITRSVIALAHTLDISVVADGVENKEQLEFLKWEACELGQGNFLAKPLPVDEFLSGYG